MSSEPSRPPPTAVGRIIKRGSLTPSVRNFLHRYPPAIIDDTPPPPAPQPPRVPTTSFDRRFPAGYAIADSSIPLHPDEVPFGYEKLFSPTYSPICKQLFWLGFLFPPLWVWGGGVWVLRRIQLNSIIDPKVYWTRMQWLKLNAKYGASCAMAFVVVILLIVIIVMVIKTYS